jgi:Uma2 family endonuclease
MAAGRYLTSGFGVDLGARTVRYPDVVVDVAGGAFNDLTATSPVLIAEVLSPSSATDDLGDKAAEYLRLSSLVAYIVLASDNPKAWIWIRYETGLAPGPSVISEPNGVVEVPALGINLPISEIFERS